MKPGRQIDFVMPDGEKVKAIVTRVEGYPGFEHLASSYSVTLAVPGEVQFYPLQHDVAHQGAANL